MATADAFLQAILTHPEDDAPRLQYADWLEGDGPHDAPPHLQDPARAEFIRVQVELAAIAYPFGDCHNPKCPERGCDLRRREREVFYPLASRILPWAQPDWHGITHHDDGPRLTVHLKGPGGEWRDVGLTFRRGFPDSLTLTAADWLAHADALVWHPGQTEACGECGANGRDAHGTHAWQDCPTCKGSGRVPRPTPPGAMPVERVRLTSWPRVLTFDRGLQMFHFEGRQNHQFTDWMDDRHSPDDVCRRLLRAEWPGIEFELPPPNPHAETNELLRQLRDAAPSRRTATPPPR